MKYVVDRIENEIVILESLETQLKKEDILPGILKLLEDAKKKKLKMAIASSSKNAKLILEKLDILGINESTLFPEMDKVSKYYVEKFK